MRTVVVTLGLSLLVSASSTAQTPASRVSVDFGLVQARKSLPQVFVQRVPSAPRHVLPFQPSLQVTPAANPAPPIDCGMVKSHRHDLMPVAMPTIKPPSDVRHHLKVVTVAPCPVR